MYQEYCAFREELSHFSQVVYAYSNCSERFEMDPRLDEEALSLVAMGYAPSQ